MYFYILLAITAGLAGLIRYNVRFRMWRINGQPNVCWAILLNTAMASLYVGWLGVGISSEVSAGLVAGAVILGAVSGEIARELLVQVSRGVRWSIRQVARIFPLVALVFGGVYLLRYQPETARGLIALFIAVYGLAIICGRRPFSRRRRRWLTWRWVISEETEVRPMEKFIASQITKF